MNKYSEKIPVSEKLDLAVEEGMKDVYRIHRKNVVKKAGIAAGGFAAFCMVFLIWGYTNPVLASQIPVIGRIFERVEHQVSYSGDYSGKSELLGTEADKSAGAELGNADENAGANGNAEDDIASVTGNNADSYTAEDNGYTITAKEVYCDGISLYLGISIKKDSGYGKIANVSTTEKGSITQEMVIFSGFLSTGDGKEAFLGNTSIEGIQSSEDTFEGILKADVSALQLEEGAVTVLDISLEEFSYADLELQDHFIERGEWKISFPITASREEVREYALDEQENGLGVEKVTVTPYEVRVQTILPPMRFDNYGAAVFDQNGKRQLIENVKEMEKGIEYTYFLQEQNITELHIYIAEGEHETYKETDESAMAARALFQTTVILK